MTVPPRDGRAPLQPLTPHRVLRSLSGVGFRVEEFVQPPRLGIDRHAHDAATLLVVVAGEVTDTFGARRHRMTAGDVLTRPAGEPHAHRYGSTGARCIAVVADRGIAAGWTEAASPFARVVHGEGMAPAAALAAALDAPDATRQLDLEARIVALCGRLVGGGSGAGGPASLSRVREMLHDQPFAGPSLEALAAVAGVHPGHLTRAFRARFGCSIGEYARARRVERAAALLADPARTIADVALGAGFYDQSHFTRVFRRVMGTTPRAWRRAPPARPPMRRSS